MAKKQTYKDMGSYSDLEAAADKSAPLWPVAKPGKKSQKKALEFLAFDAGMEKPAKVKVEQTWEEDGVVGQLITWSVGYGPRTEAWYLRPADAGRKPLPGVLALHDHGGFKWWGKEKVAKGPGALHPLQAAWHERAYDGRPWANDLAKRGFAVLVHDIFCWGSRKFEYSAIPQWDKTSGDGQHNVTPMEPWPGVVMPDEISRYSWTAAYHENTVAKTCHVLGTTFPGIIAYEDRLASRWLATRKDVLPGGVGCVGLSGGGMRAGLLQASCNDICASVVAGAMTTYQGLLDHNIWSHTWMLYPSPELSRFCDYTDFVACRAPSPLMVQYDEDDALFSPEGMKAADKRLKERYKDAKRPQNYEGRFYPGPHKFDQPMQNDAFDFLAQHVGK